MKRPEPSGRPVTVVTGAAGFIGSHLCERLLARGERVVGLDNFDLFYPREAKERNLTHLRGHPAFSLVEGDVRSAQDLGRALGLASDSPRVPPSAVVHLAALAGVQPSLQEPERFYDVNVMGTVQVLQSCRQRGVRSIVIASSSSVYGMGAEPPFGEDAPCGRPLSPYAASKRACELIAYNACHVEGGAVTCLRFFTVYGPRQRPDLAICKFVRAIARGEPIVLFGDGRATRDYTFIDDIVDGVVAALDRSRASDGPHGHYGVYNLGGGRATDLRRLVDLIAARLGREPRIVWKPDQLGDMPCTLADITAAHRDLGYTPRVPIEQGLSRFVDWWKEQ